MVNMEVWQFDLLLVFVVIDTFLVFALVESLAEKKKKIKKLKAKVRMLQKRLEEEIE